MPSPFVIPLLVMNGRTIAATRPTIAIILPMPGAPEETLAPNNISMIPATIRYHANTSLHVIEELSIPYLFIRFDPHSDEQVYNTETA